MRASQAGLLVVLGMLAGACSGPSNASGATPSALSSGPKLDADVVCGTNSQQALDAYNEGEAYGTSGEIDAPMLAYRRAIELDPGYCDAMDNLGVLLRQQGQIVEAIEWYQKSLALAPDNPVAHNNLAVALRLQGDFDGAESEYQALVEIAPSNPEGHYGLGMTDLDRGKPMDAIPHLTRAKELYAANSSPWAADAEYQLGVAYVMGEDCGAALTYFEPLYPANAENPELNWYMGVCYVVPETENLELAKKHLSDAQRLGVVLPEELSSLTE